MPERSEKPQGNAILYIRMALALVFVIASQFIGSYISIILCIAAAVISGFDIIIDAYESVISGRYFSRPVVLTVCSVILFIIGAYSDGALIFTAFHAGMLFLDYAKKKSYTSAAELLNYCNPKDKERIERQFSFGRMASSNYRSIAASADTVLKAAIVFSVFYAVFTPMVFNFSFAEAVRRAIAVIAVSNVFSLIASSDEISFLALCCSATLGVIFKNQQHISDLSSCDVSAVERNGVLTSQSGGNIYFKSKILDTDRMILLCAHAVCLSTQSFAQPILNLYNGELNKESIKDFKEIPGVGVGINISGMHLVLANSEYYSRRGVEYPEAEKSNGTSYYLTINDTYAGYVFLEETLDEEKVNITELLKSVDMRKNAVISAENKEKTEELAFEYGFDYFYPDKQPADFNAALSDLRGKNGKLLFIHSETAAYSEATVNLSVNHESDSDLLYKESIGNIAQVIDLSDKARFMEGENAIIAFVVKCVTIILALTGIGNAWFAVFIDLIGATVTVLNSFRLLHQNDLT